MEDIKVVRQEATGSNDYSHIIKGKRTKRQRLQTHIAAAMTSSSSGCGRDDQNISSSTSSIEISASTEEEEMANCLILLAQGGIPLYGPRFNPQLEGSGAGRFSCRKFSEAETTTAGKDGFHLYECKTCNRCFPSFQALGGHRASHKKPKAVEENENETSNSLPFQMVKSAPYNKSRVHECSICGSEFSSGQALGGHMRRHRPAIVEALENRKERSILALDLNLPAPEDDHDLLKSTRGFTKQSVAYAASATVDCHY
ncbi:zinc finger protein ZAT5-like [Magnolia sinica]|uniref:zinc finger protein ZAT5-like n=1 Tax=Magnolia sinica TaxID=86752 RepID=UPI00265AF7D3|nr:zinc finger protein ZAT5-like [Magnolia sinica]